MKFFFVCLVSAGVVWGQSSKNVEANKGGNSATLAPAVSYDTTTVFAKARYDTLLLTPEFFRTNGAGRKLSRANTFPIYEFSGAGSDSMIIAFVVADTFPNVKKPILNRLLENIFVLYLPSKARLRDFLIYSARIKENSNPIYDVTIFETGPLTESDMIHQASRNFLKKPQRYEQMTAFVGAKPVNVVEITKLIRRGEGDMRLQRSLGLLLTRRGRDDFAIERVPSIFLAVGLVFVSEDEDVAGNGLSK